MRVAEQIEERIREALQPIELEIEDQSHQHAGHAGARPGGQTHFRVTVVSEAFADIRPIERQRLVIAAVGDLMDNPIHALSISARPPASAHEAVGKS